MDSAQTTPTAKTEVGASSGGETPPFIDQSASELGLCIEAYETLKAEGVAVRVVSMPSWELFEQQDQAYRESVFPPDVAARVSVEAASVLGWDRYVGSGGAIIGMHTLGSSAPIKDLMKKFGFTPDKVVEAARQVIAKAKEN